MIVTVSFEARKMRLCLAVLAVAACIFLVDAAVLSAAPVKHTRKPPTPQQKYNHANRLLYSGKVEEARQGFMALLTEHPDDPIIPRVYMGLGEVYRRQGLPEYAYRMYETLIDQFPDFKDRRTVQDRMVNILIRDNRLREAELLLLELLEERSGERHLGRRLASVLERQGKTAEAVSVYEQLFKLTGDSWVRDKLFSLYDEMDTVRKKRLELEALAREQPDDQNVRKFLAELLKHSGEYPAAAQVLAELVRLNPGNPSFHFKLGQAYMAYGDELAIDEFKEAMKLNPGDTRFAIALGNAHYNAGRTREALGAWRKVIDQNPDKPQVYRTYATILSGHGLLDEVILTYRTARKRFRNPALYYSEIAELFTVEGRFGEAVDEYLGVIRNNPGYFAQVKGKILTLAGASPETGTVVSSRLEELLDKPGKHPEISEILALHRINEGQAEDGADLLASVSRDRSDGGRIFLTVAQQQQHTGQLKNALVIVDRGTRASGAAEVLPELMFQKSVLLKALGRNREAADLLKNVTAQFPVWPGRPRALALLGKLCLEYTGEWLWAEKAFTLLVEKFPAVWKNQAEIGLAELALRQGHYDESMKRLSSIAATGGETGEKAIYLTGLIHLHLFKVDEALDAFTRLQASYPAGSLVNDALRWTYLLTRTRSIPEEDLRRFLHAHSCFLSARFDEAHEVITVLTNGDNGRSELIITETLLLKGTMQERTGSTQEAVDTYRKLAGAYPEAPAAHMGLYRAATLLATRLDRPDEARGLFKELVLNYPESLLAAMVRSIYGEELLR